MFMDFPLIKVVVFDFDETLYSHPQAQKFYVEYIKNAITDLSGHSQQEALEIIKQYGFDKRGAKRVSFGKTCKYFGVDENDWNKYKVTHFFEVDYDTAQTVDNLLLKKLSQKYTLVILSNELLANVLYKARKLKIDLDVFDKIYAPDYDKGIASLSKKETYKQICADYGVTPQNVLAIGDRYQVDILPLAELGGSGVQIASTIDIENLITTELL
ncbi:MAG: HAD family hydrolase [Corallococcus sp.]|nr:HAD family hydrolase [Corallococcus sp.]